MTTMETNLEYAITSIAHNNYLNLPRDVSSLNARGYASTNKGGDTLVYVCDFEFLTNASTTTSINIYTAPLTWKLKSAMKKFHALREFMFRESGIRKKERGVYSKEIRPYFDPIHQAYPQHTLSPLQQQFDATGGTADNWHWNLPDYMTGGDWTYSQIAVETNPDTPDTNAETDTFWLHLCGPNVNNVTGTVGSDQNWDSVGMIDAFNADRSQPTAEPDDPVDFRQNPLALLRGRSESTMEVVAINTGEALDGPPYDTTASGDSVNPVLGGYLETTGTGAQITRAYGVRIPAGLALIDASDICEFRVVVRRIELA